ncbi:MAG: hypothetical protein IT162_11480 [Bryobacterales bacterium]|nr:hypothetical protein [Bryobacterales bacterium]
MSEGTSLKRFILWDYARASWQYDVMVGLILAFIFLTPREVFRDQPRANNITLVDTDAGGSRFLVEPEILSGQDETARRGTVNRLIHSQAGGRNRQVERIEPIFDAEKDLRGYLVYTKP